MKIAEKTTTDRMAVFTREEILTALGIDLRDFFLARLPISSDTLILHYMPKEEAGD